MSDEPPRWVEVDPWGNRISCVESVWAAKVEARGELALHEDAIRATVRDPDRVYIDWFSTLRRSITADRSDVTIVHYIAEHRTQGKWAGNFVSVVVKWLGEAGAIQGYVQTAYLPDRILARLQLHWRRQE